jgi:hypothetical protein
VEKYTTSAEVKFDPHLTSNFGALLNEAQNASVNRVSINSETTEEDPKQSPDIDASIFEAPNFEFDGEFGKRRTTLYEIAQQRL